MFCCVYQYRGLTYPDEVSFAASIALQAYFEGRAITPGDMRQCLVFWKQNISEREDPVGRKRPVCCEPYYVPMPDCAGCYRGTHLERRIPYEDEDVTAELRDVYEKYEKERLKQIESYETYYGPVQNSTLCRQGGWRRCYGRKGFCFCTEGCKSSYRKEGEPAPPFDVHDFDDEWDASGVLMKVLGPPPPNVVIRRWRWDPEKGENFIETYPDDSGEISGKSHDA